MTDYNDAKRRWSAHRELMELNPRRRAFWKRLKENASPCIHDREGGLCETLAARHQMETLGGSGLLCERHSGKSSYPSIKHPSRAAMNY